VTDGHGVRPPRDEAERVLRERMAREIKLFQAEHPELKSINKLSKKTRVNRHTLAQIIRGQTTPDSLSRARLYEATRAKIFIISPPAGTEKRAQRPRQPSVPPGSTDRPELMSLLREVKELSAKVDRLGLLPSYGKSDRKAKIAVGPGRTTKERAQEIARILGNLDRELAFFRDESRRDARHVLRKVVDAKDVGYLIALLKAMYDDDAFENWIFGAQYVTRSD